MLAKLFCISDSMLETVIKLSKVVHQGVWLGLLDRNSLHLVSALQYSRWLKYQNDDYNLSGLTSWEEAVWNSSFHHCQKVVVGSAGGGREAFALADKGAEVDAFECSKKLVLSFENLLARGKTKIRIFQSAYDEVPDLLDLYDGAIIGWGGYMHIPNREQRILFLRQFRAHLNPGSPILVSFFTRSPYSRQHKLIANLATTIQKLLFKKKSIEEGDTLSGTFDHYFTESEIEAEFRAGGFKLKSFSSESYGHAVGFAI